MDSHWQAVKKILRYLKHIVSTGLLITKANNFRIQAYSNSDWAGDRDDQRSVGAHCIFQGPNIIYWSCKQQQTVAQSSTVVEYKLLANTAAKIYWLRSLLLNSVSLPLNHLCFGAITLEQHISPLI